MRSILEGYLFNIQPPDYYLKCKLPSITVETKERIVRFDFGVRIGTSEYHSWAPKKKDISQFVDQVNAYNGLVNKNTELLRFESQLSEL